MGEFRVHRVRFCDYTPNAIHCLAYDESQQKLAVSRSDGTIEIWNLKEDWLQEMILPPSEGSSVEALQWFKNRLFSAGLDGNIHEHDLVTRKIKHTVSSNSGPIWCLALKEDGTQLAAGTEAGCVVLYDITSDGVEYARSLSKLEGRILSVAWHSSQDVMVTGGVDNIRIWSLVSGHAIQRLTLAKVDKNKETIVWALAVTKDFTIISGDSTGKTSFWNGRQGTLIKSFKSHRADVLCLCVNPEGTSVFCSGVDPNLIQFDYVSANQHSDWNMWVRSSVRSQHTHDVRAVVFAKNGVISAGIDAHMIYNHIDSQAGVKPWKRIPSIPQAPMVYTAKSSNMIMFRYSDSLELWKLGSTSKNSEKNGEILPLESKPLKLLQLKSRDGEFITCAAVSPNAEWIVYSDQHRPRLFHIEREDIDVGAPRINITRVRYLPPGVQPAHHLRFTADGSQIISVTNDGRIQVIKVDAIQPSLLHTFTPPGDDPEVEKPVAIHLVAVCPRGKYIATGDLAGHVHIYNIHKAKHTATLPELSNLPAALAFHPTSAKLLVAFTNQVIVEFCIPEKSFSEWTLQHMYQFPMSWQKSIHKIHQIMYNHRDTKQIIVHTARTFTIINKSQSFPDKKAAVLKENKPTNKAFHTCNMFQYLLHVDLLEDNFMLVVERSPHAMSEALPAALKQKKFAT